MRNRTSKALKKGYRVVSVRRAGKATWVIRKAAIGGDDVWLKRSEAESWLALAKDRDVHVAYQNALLAFKRKAIEALESLTPEECECARDWFVQLLSFHAPTT